MLLMMSACSGSASNSIAFVTVRAPETMPAVIQLQVTVRNGGATDYKVFPAVSSGAAIIFPTSFAVSFLTSRSGNLNVAVSAVNADSQVVAVGQNDVVIVPGGRADTEIDLELVGGGDAGSPGPDAGTVNPDVPSTGSDGQVAGGTGGSGGVGGMVSTGGTMTPPNTGAGGMILSGGITQAGTGGAGGIVGTGGSASGGVGSGGVTGIGGSGLGRGGRIGTGGSASGGVGSGGATGTGGSGLGTGGVTGTGGSTGGSVAACAFAAPIADGSVSGGRVSINTTGTFCFVTCDKMEYGWGCDTFTDVERTVKVNGTMVACGATLPAQKPEGYYYFEIGAGGHTWDAIHWSGTPATSCPTPPGGFSP